MKPRTRGLLWWMLMHRSWWVLIPWAIVIGTVCTLLLVAIAAAATWALLRLRPDRFIAWCTILLTAPAVAVLVLVAGRAGYFAAWSDVLAGFSAHGFAGIPLVAGYLVLVWVAFTGPAFGAAFWLADQRIRERTNKMSGPEERRRREAIERARRLKRVHTVQAHAHGGDPDWRSRLARQSAVPLTIEGRPVLGRVLDGDLDWPRYRHGMTRGLITLPEGHVTILGATGAGKSEVTMRIVEAAIAAGDAHVIFVNCKQAGPGQEPALRLATLAEQYGRSFHALVRTPEDGSGLGSPWDPMRGTPDDVRQRLLGTEVWVEEYWKHASAVLLGLALELHSKAGEPLSTLPDLIYGLRPAKLQQLAAEHDPHAVELVEILGDREISGAMLRWMSQALTLRGWVGDASEGGWSFEDADVCSFDLPSSTSPETARSLVRGVLAEFAQWIGDPNRRELLADGSFRPVVFVIEEVSAVESDPVIARQLVNLVERARSARVRVVLVAQGPSGLGEDTAVEEILTNTIVMTCRQTDQAAVDRLASLAGTRRVVESSDHYTGHLRGMTTTAEGSQRVQDVFRVHPNDIRALGMGEVIVMHRNQSAHLAVGMTEQGYRKPAGELVETLRPALEAARASGPAFPRVGDPGGPPVTVPAADGRTEPQGLWQNE